MQINIENKPLESVTSEDISRIYAFNFLPYIKRAKEKQGLIIYKGWRIWCIDNEVYIYSSVGERYLLTDSSQ